jgi:hypothetical protein
VVEGRPAQQSALRVEENGINVISDAERHGTPRQLFWPWFAAGDWAFANLGVLLALAFVATLVGTRAAVRAQERA